MTKTLGTKFPQSRFSFDCKRLDVITCIRHDPNADEYQNLLVSSTSNIADFNVLLDTYEYDLKSLNERWICLPECWINDE